MKNPNGTTVAEATDKAAPRPVQLRIYQALREEVKDVTRALHEVGATLSPGKLRDLADRLVDVARLADAFETHETAPVEAIRVDLTGGIEPVPEKEERRRRRSKRQVSVSMQRKILELDKQGMSRALIVKRLHDRVSYSQVRRTVAATKEKATA